MQLAEKLDWKGLTKSELTVCNNGTKVQVASLPIKAVL